MFDVALRRLVDPTLERMARRLAHHRIDPNALTLGGLAIGLSSVPLLACHAYGWALLAILINRAVDGLDGALARQAGQSSFGGYLDIVCDMAFYAAVPFGFALAEPANALWAALLLASFVCTAASFLGRAILAGQRGEAPPPGQRRRKSFFHAWGLIEGGETIFAFVVFCLWPAGFPWLAAIFAGLCFLTAFARVVGSRDDAKSGADRDHEYKI